MFGFFYFKWNTLNIYYILKRVKKNGYIVLLKLFSHYLWILSIYPKVQIQLSKNCFQGEKKCLHVYELTFTYYIQKKKLSFVGIKVSVSSD